MPPRQPDKAKLTPELKQEIINRVAEFKIEGKSNKFISDTLSICWNSVDKYWKTYLSENNTNVNLDELLLDRQAVTERLVSKAVRDHYDGKVSIKDIEIAMSLADRYNGLALKILATVGEKLPALLTIEVTNVEVELPPGATLVEQILDFAE